MNLQIENLSKFQINTVDLEHLFEFILTSENQPSDSEANLLLSDDGSICEMNRRFRGNEKRTDVLSFPADLEFTNFLGDIIIDIDTADSQKGNYSLEDEVKLLFLHGVLHLLGYDHLAKKDKIIMDEKEKIYKTKFLGGLS